MASCDSIISMGLARNCANPLVRGFERKGWIINRSDIDFSAIEYASSGNNVITTLPLKSGAKAYTIEQYGQTPYTGSSVAITPGTYGASVTNTINVVVMDASPEVHDKFIDPAMDGEFVVVLEQKFKGTNAAFRVFGFYQGLTMAESTNEFYSDDTMGGFPLSLVETNVPKSALFLWNGDYEDTLSVLNSLVG